VALGKRVVGEHQDRMSTSSQHRHEAPFRACIGEAAQRGKLLMERMVQGARQSLPQRIALANDAREREAAAGVAAAAAAV
jgi:hypothetical protein